MRQRPERIVNDRVNNIRRSTARPVGWLTDYLDTSAFIKLVRSERESRALRRELAGSELVSSALLTVEERRAARRYGDLAVARARAALVTVTLVALDQSVLDVAAELDLADLRSRRSGGER